MDFSVCVLASGSTGNSVLVSSRSTRLLVDAGLSGKKTLALLEGLHVAPEDLSGIVVTHEHHDHIQGVGPLARKLQIPVLATPETFRAARDKLKKLPKRRDIYAGRPTRFNDLTLMPFPTFHDAAGAIALVCKSGSKSLGIVTDIGHFSRLAFHRLKGCSTIVLESNYCPTMLRDGPYPWRLKQRIKGRRGHLSNQDACKVITELARCGLKKVVLSHLSETNNHPDVVMRTLVECLPPDVMERTEFFLTHPDKPSTLVHV